VSAAGRSPRGGLAGWTLLVAVLAGGCTPAGPEPVTHVAVVTDRSDSIERGDGLACRAVRALVESAVRREGPFSGLHVRGGRSRVQVFGTPDASTPGVPKVLLDPFRVPSLPWGMEGREAKRRRFEAEVADLLDRVETACRSVATRERTSPIYTAVKAAVGWLTVQMEEPDDGVLVLQSDLVETHEKPIAGAIRAFARGGTPDLETLRRGYGLDLGGRIGVFVCGVSLGTDIQDERARSRVVDMWRQSLLVNARWWRVQPTCPGYGPQGAGP